MGRRRIAKASNSKSNKPRRKVERAPQRKKRKKKASDRRSTWETLLWVGSASFVLLTVAYLYYLDITVRNRFTGALWSVPAHVFTRPQELYAGLRLSATELQQRLAMLGYREVPDPREAGQYRAAGNAVELVTRPFTYWDGLEPSRHVRLRFAGLTLARVDSGETGAPMGLARIEPVRIASIYPAAHEDRLPVQVGRVPPLLIDALLVVEDRVFFEHVGVRPGAILRALVANLRAGKMVQGGSTLTQQLIKNLYLSNERTLRRKLKEALMALLLEWHFEKEQILEAYLNEVYLGQDGRRAIHGFGLASRYYFNRPPHEVDLAQLALLVGLVKGPSYYNPWRHPKRALERRNVVLKQMADTGLITAASARTAKQAPLKLSERRKVRLTAYPAYLDLVKRQLRRNYDEEYLKRRGLRIFTNLDLQVQNAAERAVTRGLPELERKRSVGRGKLQGAVIVANTDSGEVLAVVGDRRPRYFGFNRALDAKRPIGSLIKPAVYLTALNRPAQYTLASLLDDQPLQVSVPGGQAWAPVNYDRKFHGAVPLFAALANSYNVATARLGMTIGLADVAKTVHALGFRRPVPGYPAVLLGALALSPMEVAQMYQTIASGGFRAPLRSINAVLSVDGEPLGRYPLKVQASVDPKAAFLLQEALRRAVKDGTARGLKALLPVGVEAAGKTGTTDDLRDSWFAGYSGGALAVVWLGQDDHAPAGLTGGQGALRVWAAIMADGLGGPLQHPEPQGLEWAWIETATGRQSGKDCPGSDYLPFIGGSVPSEYSTCSQPTARGPLKWLRKLFH